MLSLSKHELAPSSFDRLRMRAARDRDEKPSHEGSVRLFVSPGIIDHVDARNKCGHDG